MLTDKLYVGDIFVPEPFFQKTKDRNIKLSLEVSDLIPTRKSRVLIKTHY